MISSLTDPQLRALKILARIAPNYQQATTAKAFALNMWPNSSGWTTLSDVRKGVVRGKAMPGLGGRFLWRLRQMGFVRVKRASWRSQYLFYISQKGRNAIKQEGK
jgi:hypothetical protein